MMKKTLLRSIFAIVLILVGWSVSAQPSINVEETVAQIVKEHDGIGGVECLVIQKGEGLGLVKALFSQKFGKEFMKGVTSMTIINYSKASNETYMALRRQFDTFSSVLQEFNLGKKDLEEGQYVKAFASVDGESAISNLMLIIEDRGGEKMFIYMGGVIRMDKLQLQL